MRLPKDILTGAMKKPRLFLCETNKERICELDTISLSGTFKFNAYSELTFTVPRTYTNMITGETQVNPHYNKIEALRLLYLESFGYFEIQDPELVSDGIKEVKNVTAYSLEYTLSQKYLENLKINTGEVDSIEVIEANGGLIVPVTLYNDGNENISLLNIILEKVYGWKIGHIDESLKTMGRTFEISRVSIYDFIIQDICDKFNCFAVFDTINNTINLYAEALITKHIGDGRTSSFFVSPPYATIGSVSVDSYKTTAYTYNSTTGRLDFDVAPANGSKIEIIDGSQEKWTTDVYVSFDNLAQEVNVSYSADDIKTVLTVKGADDLDIREVNMGLPYIVDLSYYYTVDWMGQDLFDAYTKYLQNCNNGQVEYKTNAEKMLEINNCISYEKNRLSLQYSIADNVTSSTVGTYYVRGGTYPDYYYTEVSLPDDYNANVEHYYMLSGSDLDETKVSNLYEALKVYFSSQNDKDTSDISDLKDSFAFMETYTISYLVTELQNASTTSAKDTAVKNFLDEMWDQLGLTPLKTLYYEPYQKIKETNEEAGWNSTSNENYWNYYPVTLIISSLEKEIEDRENTIEAYEEEYNTLQNTNNKITNNALMDVFFKNYFKEQGLNDNESQKEANRLLIRLDSFLREDEYTDDNFVETDIDTIDTIMQTKQELLECGRIELSKLCEPKLEFSMNMANIYALPEFEPIIDQFQLGNLINVAIRSDYIKRARLLEVDINFDDFADFTCEFGELTNLKTPSSIHADLLANALTAGKSVASNASYWNKSSDSITSLSLLIQQGLLDAATVIKAIDGTQGVSIDKNGIHLRKFDPVTGALDPKEGWIVNNQFLYSDDNFQTTKSVFGEYTIDGQTKWGLLAEAVMAGYIAGCTIEGGVIRIGERPDGNYNFEVDQNGIVTFYGGKSVNSNGEEVNLDDYNTNIELTSDTSVINSDEDKITLTCKIYSYGIDVTDTYDPTAFSWSRSTGDDETDAEWNTAQNESVHGNTIVISSVDLVGITFFQCQVNLVSGNQKISNSLYITTANQDVHVFTAQPNGVLEDGYCYHAGDLWVVGQDYQPNSYPRNTILVSVADNTSYSDDDWVESVFYSKTFSDVHEWQSSMQEHVQILDDGLHLIGPSSEGVSFESVLQSDQLTFRSNHGDTSTDVVWLGVDDMTAKNVTAINYVNVQPETEEELPYIKLGNFVLQIEDNGSFSIL